MGNMAKNHVEGGGGFAFALAGMNNHQAFFVGLGCHDLVACGFFLCHFHGMAINIFTHGVLLYFFQFIDSVVGRKQGFLNHEITRWLREFSWTLLPLLAPNTPSCEFSGVPAQRHCQMKLVWMRFS